MKSNKKQRNIIAIIQCSSIINGVGLCVTSGLYTVLEKVLENLIASTSVCCYVDIDIRAAIPDLDS